MSDMRLKILHPEGPNHEPELNGAKAPTQGNLPVLETRNTEPMVKQQDAQSLWNP